MRTEFIAAKIPGGADYASFREEIDGEDTIVVVYDRDTLARLTEAAGPDCDIASYLCALVLNEQMSSTGRHLRLVS